MVKNPPAMWETCVQPLHWEDPVEEGMDTHPSILAWRIPWTEELGRLQSMGSQRVRHDWVTSQLHLQLQQQNQNEIWVCIHNLFCLFLVFFFFFFSPLMRQPLIPNIWQYMESFWNILKEKKVLELIFDVYFTYFILKVSFRLSLKEKQESLLRICQSPESINQCFAVSFNPEVSPLRIALKKTELHTNVYLCVN